MSALPADAPAEMFQAALDALPLPVFVYDDREVLYTNDRASQILRAIKGSDLVGKDLDGFVLPGLEDVSAQRRRYVLNGGIHLRNLMIKVRGADGQPIELRVDIRQIRYEGRAAAMATLASGDGQESARKATRSVGDARSLHEAALCALDTPLLVHGEKTIFFANPAALDAMHAANATQIIGADVSSIVHRDGIDAGRERRRLVLASGQSIQGVPVKLRTIDGRTVYATADARRIEWAGLSGILVIAQFAEEQTA